MKYKHQYNTPTTTADGRHHTRTKMKVYKKQQFFDAIR